MLQKLSVKLIFYFLIFTSAFLPAKTNVSNLNQRKLMLFVSSDFHFTNSKADQVTGAVYDHQFTNPYTLNAGLGLTVFNRIYLGVRYEYWVGQRQLTLQGIGQTDTLKIQNIGGDVGWVTGNPRVFWILMASAYYPILQGVEVRSTTTQTYQTLPMRFGYSGRLEIGIKFNNTFSLLMEGGYRFADFGQPQSNTSNYLSNGDFVLSGPFGGIGLAVLFW